MPRIAYVNGRYLPHAQAAVHIEDRGFQFADAVYEVCEIRHGFIVDLTRHLDRLERSLRELGMSLPMSRAALTQVIREVARRNRVRNGLYYLQISRGSARRDHVFPPEGTPQTVVVTAKSTDPQIIARKNASGDHGARQSLGPRRYQDCRPAAERHGASGCERSGRT